MTVAHLGHAELRVTDMERSRWFFTEVLGLYVSEETEEKVYLRAWQDWDHHTLILTRSDHPGVEHVGWRVEKPQDLGVHEKRLGELGIDHHWIESGEEAGQGDGLRFTTPGGMPFELYWEREAYAEPEGSPLASRLPSHPQKFASRGVAPRRFDHMNFLVDEPGGEQEWMTRELGIHHRYYVRSESGDRLASWLSRTSISHEIAVQRNRNQNGPLLHHAAYYLDSPDQLLRAATILADNDIEIEWGPGNHGTSGALFLYCFEPSGNRIEVWTGGFLIFAPDWEPIGWTQEKAELAYEFWGSAMPDTYLTYGTASHFTNVPARSASTPG
ncbi:MAG: VOC family protein [Rubrobacter sp.]|jgi:catechol 2,3 dioxygenase|nr:VOC family protein [Rubrobacter sp.]